MAAMAPTLCPACGRASRASPGWLLMGAIVAGVLLVALLARVSLAPALGGQL